MTPKDKKEVLELMNEAMKERACFIGLTKEDVDSFKTCGSKLQKIEDEMNIVVKFLTIISGMSKEKVQNGDSKFISQETKRSLNRLIVWVASFLTIGIVISLIAVIFGYVGIDNIEAILDMAKKAKHLTP